jgi:hypothetical protein
MPELKLDAQWRRKMTDTDVEQVESTILRVNIPKAKSFIEVETDKLPTHVYQEALVQGLKVLLTKGQTTFTKEKFPDPDELQAAALAKTEQTLRDLYDGKITIRGGAKADKVPREVMTAARNIARKMVKELLKRRGVNVTQVKSSDITKAANLMLASNPSIIEKARKEQEDIEKSPIDLDMEIEVDPKLVAAQAKKKTDKTLSKTQAGKVMSRTRQ